MKINSETLRQYRDKMGLSQKEFSEFLGISHRSLQGYESGDSIPEAKKALIKSKIDAKDAYSIKEDTLDRFEDVIARKVIEKITPILEENKKALNSLLLATIESSTDKREMQEKLDALGKKINLLTEIDKEVLDRVSGK